MRLTEGEKTLSKTLSKLIDALSKAIGKVYEPRHVRKMADAEAYRINKISEAVRNNVDLPIVFNGTLTVDTSDYDGIRERAGSRLAFQEIQKQENIESVVDKAYIELDGKELESDEPISPEWMNRFINIAGEISTEEMQNIWAKVLAGEVVRPSSYSMKTLECLRNLSVKDAELFARIANCVISDSFVYGNSNLNQRYGITYNDLLILDECGLINSDGLITLEAKTGEGSTLIMDFGTYVLFASSESQQMVKASQFPLTRAGRELVSIARTNAFDEKYMKEIAKEVKANNTQAVITLHHVKNRFGTQIQYDRQEIELDV